MFLDGINFQILVHISHYILIKRFIWLSNWCHFWWNNWTTIMITTSLELLIEIRFIYSIIYALNIIVNFYHRITASSSFILTLKMLLGICLDSICCLMVWILHQIIWLKTSRLLPWHIHALWNHISVILVHRIVFVTIRIHINFV